MTTGPTPLVDATESSPLLLPPPRQPSSSPPSSCCPPISVVWRLLLNATLVSLSFGVTQVPLLYALGLMTCEEYYQTHSDPGDVVDAAAGGQCHSTEIQASTARAVALLGASTTLFGVLNLFYTGWMIKRVGVKSALLTSVLWPAGRLVVQNIGWEVGAGRGILIIQLSQVITVVGGPAGYLLALNSFATEIVQPAERTGELGRLQGCAFVGTALGTLLGGILSDCFGIAAPFRLTLLLFLLSSFSIWMSLPEVKVRLSPDDEKRVRSLSSFLDPLRMFIPQKWCLVDGRVQREYGILLVGAGAFVALLATGYIPILLQMYAKDQLDMGTTENSAMVCLNSLVRGLFLTLAFPWIIARGREYTLAPKTPSPPVPDPDLPDIVTDPCEFTSGPMQGVEEPIETPRSTTEESFAFDLTYSRYSILIDGILTALAFFTSQPWHIYIVAIILPLAAGTGSAAQGSVLQMCSPSQRADALSAISLIEMAARLASTGVFGYVFAAFAAVGKSAWTFTVNGSVALVAFLILMLARFPPEGAQRWDGEFVDSA